MINNPTGIIGTANQVLVNGTTGALSAGAVTLTLPQSIASGSSPTFTGLTLSGLTANSFVYSDGSKIITSTAAATNGQILIGSTGNVPVKSTLTNGTGISVTNGAGSITIANTGVTSNVAGTGISVSGATGAVTITNTGVTSLTTSSGLSTNTNATGAVTITNTGVTGLTAGTGISLSGSTGSVTVNNTGVTSVGLSLPSIFSVSGSPVTTTGTLTGTLATQVSNTVFAAPNGSTGTPTFRGLVYADLPIELYAENVGTITAPSATGVNSIATGTGAVSSIYGTSVFANGFSTTAGDAQHVVANLRNTSTTNAAVELYLNGTAATQRLVLPNNSAWTFNIKIAARRTDATGTLGAWTYQGFIYKDASSASTVLTGLSKTTLARIGSITVLNDPTITADTTNGSMKITCTGVSAQTIKWVATVQLTQVTN